MRSIASSLSQAVVGRLGERAQAWLALLFGLAVVLVVGIAQPDAIHGAAHDARHAAGFPCH